MRRTLFALSLLLTLAFCGPVLADGLESSVNIVLSDGTIMLYEGSDAGINPGDKFEVRRGGKVVGHIEVNKTKELFSYAELLDGDVEEMDKVIRTEKGTPEKQEKEEPEEETTSGGETEKAAEPADEEETEIAGRRRGTKPDREATARDRGTRGSSRRQEALREEREDEEDAASDRTSERSAPPAPSETGEKREKPRIITTEPPEKKFVMQHEPLGGLRASGFGLSGLLFIPTADSIPERHGNVHFVYADSDNDNLDKTLTGIGLGYGISENMEIAYTNLNMDYTYSGSGYSSDMTFHVLSFKFQFPHTDTPSFISTSVSEARYAAGLNYFSADMDDDDSSGDDGGDSAYRLFAVATGKYTMGTGHLGVFFQTGELLDNTDYDGFGIIAGIEYPFGSRNQEKSLADTMSLILEYDSKALSTQTMQTPSIGLRYNFRDRGHVTLALVDFTEEGALLLEGAYDY